MAFIPGEEFDEEIKTTFDLDSAGAEPPAHDEIRPLLKQHKKLIITLLNRKWHILSLESYINKGIISRGLRERIMPAANLHTERFLEKWKKQCISHGLEVMRLIVEEERQQLANLQVQIMESSSKLEPLKENTEFDKFNEILKKEVDQTQKNLKF